MWHWRDEPAAPHQHRYLPKGQRTGLWVYWRPVGGTSDERATIAALLLWVVGFFITTHLLSIANAQLPTSCLLGRHGASVVRWDYGEVQAHQGQAFVVGLLFLVPLVVLVRAAARRCSSGLLAVAVVALIMFGFVVVATLPSFYRYQYRQADGVDLTNLTTCPALR